MTFHSDSTDLGSTMRHASFAAFVVGLLALVAQAQNSSKPELLVQVGHAFQISSLDFNKDGGMLATGSWDNNVKLWDVKTGLVMRTLSGHKDFVYSVNFSPDGKTLASGGRDHTIKLWSLTRPDDPVTIPAPTEIQTVQFFPDGTRLAAAGGDGVIRIWNTQSGAVETLPPKHSNYVYSLAISPNGQMLASSSVAEIKLWNFQDRQEQTFKWCSNRVDPVVFSSDSKKLAAGCFDGTVLLLNLETGEQQTLRMHDHSISSLQFSRDGTTLGSAGGDGIKFYNLANKQVSSFEGDTRRTEAISFSPNRETLVSGDDEGGLKLWNLSSRKEMRPGFLHGDPQRFPLAESAVFSPDGSTLAVGWANGSVMNFGLNLGAGAEMRVAHSDRVSSVLFTPDSKFLITTSPDGKLKFWDLAAGGEPKEVEGYQYALTSEAFSPDKKLLAVGSKDGIRLLNLSSFESRVVDTSPDDIYSLSFAPDQHVLAVSRANRVTLLDITTGLERVLHEDHGGVLSVVRFSRDGSKAVQGQVDNTITIHDTTAANASPRILKGSTDWASRFVFDHDEKHLASFSGDQIMLWDFQTGAPMPVDESLPLWVKFDNLARLPCGDVLVVPGGNYVKLVRLVHGKSAEELLRIYAVGEDGWVAVAPDGRFDTNLPLEDIKDLGWLMPDAPLQPLPLELFMRDYYEPQLLVRLLNADDFNRLPDLAKLHRTLPNVTITDVSLPDANRRVAVTVEVAPGDGSGDMDCTKKPNRCAYDLRLYRDSHLVGSFPSAGAELSAQIPPGLSREAENEKWRAAMLLKQEDCASGSSPGAIACKFDVQLPLGKNVADVGFTAYAFNDDRVKTLTAKWQWPEVTRANLPRAVSAKPIVYVVSFGVNSFDNPRWNLKFAAQDAQSMQSVLSQKLQERQRRGEFEKVVEIKLISSGRVRQATKRNLRTVLELLAGKTPSRHDLFKLGPLTRVLQKARPDDIVILSLSSHGYANKSGLFYVLPSDIQSNGKQVTQQLLQSSISSDELSFWIRDLDAEEFVMIIDACYAEAAIVGKEFKAGPMGSRGLGQLAYDKGMRVLAATRAESEAMEVGRTRAGVVIEGGLLTYALLNNGIKQKMADYHPPDKQITVGEWLSFAVTQVPHLYSDLRFLLNGQPVFKTAGPRKPRDDVQHPSLFNFKRGPQDTLLLRVP